MAKEISANVKEMADKIGGEMQYDETTRHFTEKTPTYENLLPEDLTMDVVGKVHSYNTDYITAGTLAIGTLAQKAMVKDKAIDKITGHLKMYKGDNVDVAYNRETRYVNGLSESKEEIIKHGVVSVRHHYSAGKNAGNLAVVIKDFQETARTLFSGK